MPSSRGAKEPSRPVGFSASRPQRRLGERLDRNEVGGSAQRLDARAADDRVGAVVEAHPGLALAVVVGRPDDSVASRPPTVDVLVPSGSAPLQTRTNGFSSRSRPIVVSSVWPGSTRISSGSAMKTSITERRDLLEVAAADRVLEERVAGEDELVVDEEGDHVVGVPGRRDAAHARGRPTPSSPGSATTSMPYRARSSSSCTTWSGCECVRRIAAGVAPQRLDRGEERRDVGARVDEDAPCRPLVGDHERVREPVGMHAPLDQHGARLTGDPRRGGRMAGLMSRASLIVKSKFSKLLNRAENPTETLDYSYEQKLAAAPERQARRRRRRHREEAARAPDRRARAERRQARDAGAPGARREPRGSRAAGARAQGRPRSSSSRGSTSRSSSSRRSRRSSSPRSSSSRRASRRSARRRK